MYCGPTGKWYLNMEYTPALDTCKAFFITESNKLVALPIGGELVMIDRNYALKFTFLKFIESLFRLANLQSMSGSIGTRSRAGSRKLSP